MDSTPPEQRPVNFSAAVHKKKLFFLFYKKMCTVSYNVQEQHFAGTYCMLSYAHEIFVLLEPKIQQV